MVDVPERFFQSFDSAFPSLATLADPTLDKSLVFARAGLSNIVQYTAMESARRIEAISIPPVMGEAAAVLFDRFGAYMAGAVGIESPSVPDVLLGAADNFSAMAHAMGAFDSIPIVGMILDFALFAIDGAIAAYKFQNDEVIEANPFGYDRDRDEDWVRQCLAVHGGTDLTSLFLPVNDASDGVDILTTKLDTSGVKDTTARALYIPRGPGTGNIGGLPNTRVVPKGAEMNYAWNPRTRPHGTPWSAFMPALAQAVTGSWQSVMANSRATYLVDAKRVARAWNEWQDNMQLWGWGTRYSGNDRVRISMLSRPPVDYAAQQRIAADGYKRIVSYWPGQGMRPKGDTGHQAHYGPLLGDVGAWAADVQLGRRQRQYLGTLTVAYCSERDPAFASDPMLADLLVERRRMLLEHPAAALVDLSQVVDEDYRQLLATRQGPGGLAQPPGSPPLGPREIAAPGMAQGPGKLPPILVDKPPSAAPFLPTAQRSGGEPMRNAALLALLGFLVK